MDACVNLLVYVIIIRVYFPLFQERIIYARSWTRVSWRLRTAAWRLRWALLRTYARRCTNTNTNICTNTNTCISITAPTRPTEPRHPPLLGWYVSSVIRISNFSLIDGLVQERRNSIANALELRLSCTNPLLYTSCVVYCVLYIIQLVCKWSMIPLLMNRSGHLSVLQHG